MKKFLCFLAATIVLALLVVFMGYKYLLPKDYPVFIESFDHGVMTIDSDEAFGEDNKYEIFCNRGDILTININPERTDTTYYNLDKLTVNGIDVTDDVNMLEYTLKVEGKTTVLAYFKKGKNVSTQSSGETAGKVSAPNIIDYAKNEYLGSAFAYDIEDPSIIYDDASGYYFCFASDNIVLLSKDLQNWEKRTNYFEYSGDGDDIDESTMSFSQFDSVKNWAKTHGYSSDANVSTDSNNRSPIAPDIIKIGGAYYLYFSLSKEKDANESAIFCVKTNDLYEAISTKTWDDVGLVINSCGHNKTSDMDAAYDSVNCTDPSVFTDESGDKLYMAYGSYFGEDEIKGSINMVELDPETGLLDESSSVSESGSQIGTLHEDSGCMSGTTIANPGYIPGLSKNDGSLVTACDMAYNADTGYYYMFVTYGLSQTNYEIRVARSKDVSGPYLDINGNDMASYGKSLSNNQYTKGTMLIAGYNFLMSSTGGVSYTDVGKASIGAPSIIKTSNGKWLMASQARGYYKIDGEIYCGDEIAEDNDYSYETAPALEIRHLFFENDWPLALCETFDNESAKSSMTMSDMSGHWDVVTFDGSQPEGEYDSVTRYVSQKVSILSGAVISEDAVKHGSKLDTTSFSKVNAKTYTIVLDGVTYTVYPTYAWDNELDQETIIFTGMSDDGTVIWGKKGYNSYTGIYLDVYNYLLDIAPTELSATYQKKLDKIKENPTQEKIDKLSTQLIKKIIASEKSK